jgi:hypothetical protein
MRTPLLLSVLLALLPTAPTASASLTAQDPPDNRPEVSERIAKLEEQVDEKGEQDAEAVASIDELHTLFPESGPKDRAKIVKALKKSFSVKRKEDPSGQVDDRLWQAAAAALGDMGPESVPVLSDLIGHKSHRENLALQRKLVLSLGRTKDLKSVKTLTDLLNDKDAIVQGAAAEALGNYADAELDVRRDAFEELLKQIMSVKGRMDNDGEDLEARQRYETIRAPILTSLKLLSKRDITEPEDWQRWWNKNKKHDWDNEEDED